MGERQIVLGGVPTRVVDEGSGPVVVLVHATPFDLECWDGLAAALRPDHRVIRYDLPGHGAASSAALPAIDRLADDLVELLDVLEMTTAHIVGHSLGATIAQRCALDHPGRVERLSLLSARASPSPVFSALAGALRRDPAAVDLPMQRWFTPAELAHDGPAVRYARRLAHTTSIEAWADGLDLLAASDLLGDLPRLTIPVDVVVGGEDHGAKPEHDREIAAAIPHARFHLVERARTLLAIEHPELVAALLR